MSNLFGINGVRGVVNETLTSEVALRLGRSIGRFYNGQVAVAVDTRITADMIKNAVIAGLMAEGCNVFDLGIVPVPALHYFVKTHDDILGGVMITASHNPPKFNGIKCIDGDGTEMPREKEEKIEELYASEIPCQPWNDIGTIETYGNAGEDYVDAVLRHVDVMAIRRANLTAVLDCANGAACRTTPLLLKKLGVRAITLNADMQGEFPGHPSEPTAENLKDLLYLTKAVNADIGIAHDGDADRAVFATNDGSFVPGDKSLALMAKATVLADKGGLIVTPVSSSSMVQEVVEKAGGKLIYTAVGSPVVARRMMAEGSKFGGEENGGLIFAEHQYCRDGAMTIAKMIESIVKHGPLVKQLQELPVYYTDKRKIECPNNKKTDLIEFMKGRFSKGNKVDLTDGMKILFSDGGWVLLRPSGTEPIFRIYSESKDKDLAESRCEEFENAAKEFMNSLNSE